jgi:hypothetical protein
MYFSSFQIMETEHTTVQVWTLKKCRKRWEKNRRHEKGCEGKYVRICGGRER